MRSPPADLEEYRLLRPLGSGTMGEVYLAHDQLLDRPVAIKLLRAAALGGAGRERVLIEARAIARVQHPNVVTLFRVGETEGRPFLVSEFVRGQGLDQVPLPLPPERLRSVALGLARGLSAVHRRGVLHRDIKPANAILAEDGEVKLLDFGLAKLLDPGLPRLEDGAADGAAARLAPAPPALDAPAPDDAVAATAELPGAPDPPALPCAPAASPLTMTQPGAIIGTPRYRPPELWRGEAATVATDLYALGALLFELASGRPPHPQDTLAALRRAALGEDAPPLRTLAPEMDPRLCALIDRCLRRDPSARPPSADEVSHALCQLAEGAAAVPAGNPYRGLYPFDVEHSALFFGRARPIAHLLDRLREEPLVLVTGDSGVGKSSLCAAGLLPRVAAGALGGGRSYEILRLSPGRRPLAALLHAALPGAHPLTADPAALRDHPEQVARALRQRLGERRGALLFIDQAEELLTQSDPQEAALCAEVIGHLADRVPGVRVLLTARGDFLSGLAGLPGLGPALMRGVQVLGPLSRDELREVIVGPARLLEVRFESEAMVEALLDEALAGEGGLPLLEFALAELWESLDEERRLIPRAALERIGGVGGALARHADGVLARLLPAERALARRVLLRLCAGHGARARRSAEELLPCGQGAAVLDALVRGRLLLAQGGESGAAPAVYTLAHEALLRGWATLRGWLERDGERQAALERLRQAAAEWQRLGGTRDALPGARQLREVEAAELAAEELGPREAAYLQAARREARRRRRARGAIFIGLPLLLISSLLIQSALAQRQRRRRIEGHAARAAAALREADTARAQAAALRAQALARFDQGEVGDGEARWEEALRAGQAARLRYKEASTALGTALLIDSPAWLQRRSAEALFAQVLLAREEHRPEQEEDLLARLLPHDEGGALRARLFAPVRLRVATRPAGARARVWRYQREEGGLRVLRPEPLADGEAGAELRLSPGSYRVDLEAPGRAPLRFPVLLSPGEQLAVTLWLPPAGAVPTGFVYVPPGRFLYGSADDENWRRTSILAQPLHEVRSASGYLIGRSEVTFGEWLAFLRALPGEERARRRPRAGPAPASIEVLEAAPGRFQLLFARPGRAAQRVEEGEALRFAERPRRAQQDWLRLPVSGVSFEDALAYAAWRRAGGLRGARLCSEHEWERAARGADDRRYPHGDELGADDANHDVTYGRRPLAFGPDEVGSHPASDSPFGVQDLAGNAWEWTLSVNQGEPVIYRGGGWYEGRLSSLSINRSSGEATLRHVTMGLRLCADPPPET